MKMMNPTNKLRWVERGVYVNRPVHNAYGDPGTVSELVKKMILQQWWENVAFRGEGVNGEWIEVPVEKE